jgi:hypothetical protein
MAIVFQTLAYVCLGLWTIDQPWLHPVKTTFSWEGRHAASDR